VIDYCFTELGILLKVIDRLFYGRNFSASCSGISRPNVLFERRDKLGAVEGIGLSIVE